MIKEIHDGFLTCYLDTDTGDRYFERPKVVTAYIIRKDKVLEEKRYHLPDKMARAVQTLLENETEIAWTTNDVPFEK